MRKSLLYNIYLNISDRQFFSIEKKMLIWEYEIGRILSPLGWRKTKSVYQNDALIVDFVRKDLFFGNMGISFEDQPNKILFSFYITKSFDESNYRYFLSFDIFQNKEADFFENELNLFVNSALEKYNVLAKEDIIKLGEMIHLK